MFNCIVTLTAWALHCAIYHAYSRAVFAGSCLGWIVWELSRTAQPSTFTTAMALTVVAAGGASFVLHALHDLVARCGLPPEQTRAKARVIVSLLGTALAVSVHALQLIAD